MKSTSTATASADPTRLGWDQSSSKSILLQASGQVVIDLDWKRRLTRSFEAGIGFRFRLQVRNGNGNGWNLRYFHSRSSVNDGRVHVTTVTIRSAAELHPNSAVLHVHNSVWQFWLKNMNEWRINNIKTYYSVMKVDKNVYFYISQFLF